MPPRQPQQLEPNASNDMILGELRTIPKAEWGLWRAKVA